VELARVICSEPERRAVFRGYPPASTQQNLSKSVQPFVTVAEQSR
jgi:hypothetical protein